MKTPNIKNKIISHSKSIGLSPDTKGYVEEERNNLIDNFKNWDKISNELYRGQGSELKPNKNGVVKFRAVHSSAALCVNTFAPFKHNKSNFTFLDYSGFTEATFEKKLPTGISTPNLDFYLENECAIIGIESKFTEVLSKKVPNHDQNLEKYQNRKELAHLHDSFNRIIQDYIDCKESLYLDVAQLIKHSIGLINKAKKPEPIKKTPILVYLYWQPNNWNEYDKYITHADEIASFQKSIEKIISFIPMSYFEFWELFKNDPNFSSHIELVKNRYSISL